MGCPMKHPIQLAIIELRRRLGLTQQQLAVELGKAVVTVARWETSRIPSTEELSALAVFCHRRGLDDLTGRFAAAALESAGLGIGTWLTRVFHSSREAAVVDALVALHRNVHIREIKECVDQIDALLLSGIRTLQNFQTGGTEGARGVTAAELAELTQRLRAATEDFNEGVNL